MEYCNVGLIIIIGEGESIEGLTIDAGENTKDMQYDKICRMKIE